MRYQDYAYMTHKEKLVNKENNAQTIYMNMLIMVNQDRGSETHNCYDLQQQNKDENKGEN